MKLLPELRDALEARDKVVLDFAGVRSVLSAFLNPSVGELYGVLPSDIVDKLLTVVNTTAVQDKTLARVREHGRKYYHDPVYRAAQDAARRELFSA